MSKNRFEDFTRGELSALFSALASDNETLECEAETRRGYRRKNNYFTEMLENNERLLYEVSDAIDEKFRQEKEAIRNGKKPV